MERAHRVGVTLGGLELNDGLTGLDGSEFESYQSRDRRGRKPATLRFLESIEYPGRDRPAFHQCLRVTICLETPARKRIQAAGRPEILVPLFPGRTELFRFHLDFRFFGNHAKGPFFEVADDRQGRSHADVIFR